MLSRLGHPRTRHSETLTAMYRQASEFALRLAAAVAEQRARFQQFIDAETIFSALPIAADEFAAVRSRLRNALRYYDGGESGAAIYELRLLAGLLKPRPSAAATRRKRNTQN